MTKFLLNNTITYRVATVDEALALRDQLQNSTYGELTKFSYTTKYIKSKGEIMEEYQIVKATLEFNDAKEPEDSSIDISYGEKGLDF